MGTRYIQTRGSTFFPRAKVYATSLCDSDQMTALSEAVSALSDSVDALEASLSTVSGDVSSLTSSVTDIQSSLTELADTVAALSSSTLVSADGGNKAVSGSDGGVYVACDYGTLD